MDNRKRLRLEAGSAGGGGRTTTMSNIGQSIFFSSDVADGVLPANVFLTICGEDENSDESQEDYLTIDGSTLTQTHIKQELPLTQTSSPLQYRILNQLHQRQTPMDSDCPSASAVVSSSVQSAQSALLPTTVQLPKGCEIYLVKEYVENASPSAHSLDNSANIMGGGRELLTTLTTAPPVIKVEPGSGGGIQRVHSNLPQTSSCVISPRLTDAATVAAGSATEEGQTRKRSFILEAFQKRDDKRRATHNEVERRRRDKINSWIFKLKEMLPAEIPAVTIPSSNNCTSTSNVAAVSPPGSTVEQHQQQRNVNHNNNNTRTPPSDSKSQILIKACDYIKAMQEEVKSLRVCLTENEHLRVSNQRLQTELNKLRSEQRHSNSLVNNINISPNSNFNVTLNSLNTLNGNGGLFGSGATTTSLVASAVVSANGNSSVSGTASTPYAKRELIITDYVD